MGVIHLQSFSTVQKQYSSYWIKFKSNPKGNIKIKKIANNEGEKKNLNSYFNEFHILVYLMACFQDFSIAYYEFVNLCKSILYKYLRITTKHSLRQKIYNKSSFVSLNLSGKVYKVYMQ